LARAGVVPAVAPVAAVTTAGPPQRRSPLRRSIGGRTSARTVRRLRETSASSSNPAGTARRCLARRCLACRLLPPLGRSAVRPPPPAAVLLAPPPSPLLSPPVVPPAAALPAGSHRPCRATLAGSRRPYPVTPTGMASAAAPPMTPCPPASAASWPPSSTPKMGWGSRTSWPTFLATFS